MAVTESNMMPLGTSAPNFELIDAREGRMFSLNDQNATHGIVIMFICNHCPFVKHILPSVVELLGNYDEKGISSMAINSNDETQYPEDSFENMQKLSQEMDFPFPYLHDKSQRVAEAYNAQCTPEFYLFDKDFKLVYRGRYDASSPGNDIPVTGDELKAAMDNLIAGEPISPDQKPSIGCNIKWKK